VCVCVWELVTENLDLDEGNLFMCHDDNNNNNEPVAEAVKETPAAEAVPAAEAAVEKNEEGDKPKEVA
jgi:hypothetical protein